MYATEESAQRAIRMSTIADPDEQRRRLGQVYRLLVDLAHRSGRLVDISDFLVYPIDG